MRKIYESFKDAKCLKLDESAPEIVGTYLRSIDYVSITGAPVKMHYFEDATLGLVFVFGKARMEVLIDQLNKGDRVRLEWTGKVSAEIEGLPGMTVNTYKMGWL